MNRGLFQAQALSIPILFPTPPDDYQVHAIAESRGVVLLRLRATAIVKQMHRDSIKYAP